MSVFGVFWSTYGVNLRIQSKCGKMPTRKTPSTETFFRSVSWLFGVAFSLIFSFFKFKPFLNAWFRVFICTTFVFLSLRFGTSLSTFLIYIFSIKSRRSPCFLQISFMDTLHLLLKYTLVCVFEPVDLFFQG